MTSIGDIFIIFSSGEAGDFSCPKAPKRTRAPLNAHTIPVVQGATLLIGNLPSAISQRIRLTPFRRILLAKGYSRAVNDPQRKRCPKPSLRNTSFYTKTENAFSRPFYT